MNFDWLPEASYPYLTALAIILVTLLAGTIVNRLMKRFINKAANDLLNDPTEYVFFRNSLTAVIYLVGFSLAFYSIPALQNLARSILAGAGIAAVALGFASQAALSNIVAGVFIVIFKPFRVKDCVELRDGSIEGQIENITLRHTIIRNYQNRRVIIPNSVISDEIIYNMDLVDLSIREWIELGVAYDSDLDQVRSVIIDELEKYPLLIDKRTAEEIEKGDPKILVRVIKLNDFRIRLRIYAWVSNHNDSFAIRYDMLERLKKRFDQEGIEIPVPSQNVFFRNSLETQAMVS